jgi:hypothetical protein
MKAGIGSTTRRSRRQRGWWRIALLAVLIALAVLGLVPGAALANFYGIARFFGTNHRGTNIQVRTDSMSVPNVNTDAIANDSWVINTNASPTQFIEAAIAKGNVTYGNCNLILSRASFFWADQRPNSNYYCHSGAVASFGTYYSDIINYQGSGTWNVTIGSLSGTSSNSLTSENEDDAGLEETTQQGVSCGSSSSLSWYDGNNTQHSGWTDSQYGNAQISSQNGNPPSAYWVSQPNWLRAYSNTSC